MRKESDVYRYYMEKIRNSNRLDFVEEFIEDEINQVWDSYASILVSTEKDKGCVPDILIDRLKKTTQYIALEEYFENTIESNVFLTDDYVSLRETHDLYTILHAILGKEITVHLGVSTNEIDDVNNYLKEAAEEEANEVYALIKWKYIDDGYCFQLEKRMGRKEHILRVYPDGRGVVVSLLDDGYDVSYFELTEEQQKDISNIYRKKMNEILPNPQSYMEDDRYRSFPVVLWYGLMNFDKFAYDRLEHGYKYELQEYREDEFSFKMSKAVFRSSEVNRIWKEHLLK